MKLFLPTKYYQNIFNIPYALLKEANIKCLVFDLDNTIASLEEKICSSETKKLFTKLKKDFLIVLISNNKAKRLKPFEQELKVECVSFALKPSTRALRYIKNKHHLEKTEMIMIGDQLMTDILSGNRFHIQTILVDPLTQKDLKITGISRLIEKYIYKKYQRKGFLERGKYHD